MPSYISSATSYTETQIFTAGTTAITSATAANTLSVWQTGLIETGGFGSCTTIGAYAGISQQHTISNYLNHQQLADHRQMQYQLAYQDILAQRRAAMNNHQDDARWQEIETSQQKSWPQWRDARQRAMKLLTDNLTPKQIETFEKDKYIPVKSPSGRLYRIRLGRTANIDVVDAEGRRLHRLCAHPVDHIPDEDTMLAQKLMIEHCEQEFLEMANIHP